MKQLKELGQNFLTDPAIASEIAALGKLKPDDTVWEIGVGEGILTDALLDYGVNLTAFELDRRRANPLAEKYGGRIRLIIQDVLKADWEAEFARQSGQVKLIANIPYHITSPLLERLEHYAEHFSMVVLMLQKEVAERLTARAGTKSYGAMTLRMGLKFNTHLALHVGRDKFEPVPKVDSAVIVMAPRTFPLIADQAPGFYHLIERAFAHRRKTLRNNLLPYYKPELLAAAQIQSGIELSRRAETLNEQEFITLCDSLTQL